MKGGNFCVKVFCRDENLCEETFVRSFLVGYVLSGVGVCVVCLSKLTFGVWNGVFCGKICMWSVVHTVVSGNLCV